MPNGGTVDLMSREAIATFIKIYYEEFYKRYSQYFGNAMPATFADHEGSYGDKLPWTPHLFETFQRKAGYDLIPHLPGLIYDIGPHDGKTPLRSSGHDQRIVFRQLLEAGHRLVQPAQHPTFGPRLGRIDLLGAGIARGLLSRPAFHEPFRAATP